MPVIIVGNEKNFTALRSRIFSGRVPTAAAQEVSDAIAAANPHVDLNKLEPGTVLTVPDLPHVKVDATTVYTKPCAAQTKVWPSELST